MRRIACIAMLLTLLWMNGMAASAQSLIRSDVTSVIAATDSSGVNITIAQGQSVSSTGDPTGSMSIIVSSSSTDTTLVCEFLAEADSADISIGTDHTFDVTWTSDDGAVVSLNIPSIRIAGLLAQFTCEPEA